MRTICVVQARCGSRRLPGKVLADLGGRPALDLLLTRIRSAPVDEIVVATTTGPQDDGVASLAASLGTAVVRGPEDDVLARFAQVLAAHPADVVVRLTADCPLMDPAVVGSVLARHVEVGADYTSNTLIRSYPDGLDVEVVSAPVLLAAAAEATDPAEREHVTLFVYRRPERFRLAAVRSPLDLAHERWTLDTPADLEWLRSIVAGMARTDLSWEAIWESLDRPTPDPPELRLAGDADVDVVGHPVDDPGRRAWVARRPGGEAAWGRVSVTAGVGRLETGGPSPGTRLAFVASLQRVLRQEPQVAELVVGPDGAGLAPTELRRLGFAGPGGSGSFVWTP